MRHITLFDFDGTLTTSDSMFHILKYHKGGFGLALALLRELPLIVLMMLHLYSNHKTKQRLLYHCFGRMSEGEFNSLCKRFAAGHMHILRKETMDVMEEALSRGEQVYVISASPENWVREFFTDLSAKYKTGTLTVLGTQLNFKTPSINSFFLTRNCYGSEKVNRLLACNPDMGMNRKDYTIDAYGDSKGDHAMFDYADRAHLVK